jgi:hypothetical protein
VLVSQKSVADAPRMDLGRAGHFSELTGSQTSGATWSRKARGRFVAAPTKSMGSGSVRARSRLVSRPRFTPGWRATQRGRRSLPK